MVSMTSRILVTAWGYTLLAAVLYGSLFPGDDPHRCRAVSQTGRWVDPADKNGDREPFNKWQPDGCLIHEYSSEDIRQCMEGRNFVFTGDSTLRQVAWGMTQLLRNDTENRKRLEGHNAWTATNYGQDVTYIWNPFVRLSGTWDPWKVRPDEPTQVNTSLFTAAIQTFADEKEKKVSKKDQKAPALIVFGGGAWFSSGKDQKLRDLWFGRYSETVFNVSEVFRNKRTEFYTPPFSDDDGIGNQAFLVPPSGPVVPGDLLYDPGDSNKTSKSNERNEILRFQQWLKDTDDQFNFPMTWALPDTVEDQDKTFVEPYGNRWHYIDHIAKARANILLNIRCNAKLDRVREYPTHQNCCTDYGSKPFVQQLLVHLGILLLIVCLGFETLDLVTKQAKPRHKLLNMKSGGALVLPLLMAYYADRTQMMAKGQKVWEPSSFILICIPWVIVGFLTIQKTASLSQQSEKAPAETEQSILSDDQIAEWKGWMQLVIVLYHYFDGFSSVRLTIFSTMLISAYLFLVGYEHTSYFLAKKDYSLLHVAKVLLRQNLLTFLLCLFMDTNYTHYYYVIMYNFFFISAWAVMAFEHKRTNADLKLLLVKICASAAVIACFIKLTAIIRVGLFLLRIFCNVHWDVVAVESRLSMDAYIAFSGMLLAAVRHHIKEFPVYFRYIFAVVGLLTLERFSATWFSQDPEFSDYWRWHDLATTAPILAYIALRNASPAFRNCHSKAMAWVGGCYLELYLLHLHLFVAADNQGVLLTGRHYGDGSFIGDRWRDFVIFAPILLLVSYVAAIGTEGVVEVIISSVASGFEEDLEQSNHDEHSYHIDSASDISSEDSHSGPLARLLGNRAQNITYVKYSNKVRAFCATSISRPVFVFLALWFLGVLARGPRNVVIPGGPTEDRILESQQV